MKYLISILVVLLYFLQNKILNVRKKLQKQTGNVKMLNIKAIDIIFFF